MHGAAVGNAAAAFSLWEKKKKELKTIARVRLAAISIEP